MVLAEGQSLCKGPEAGRAWLMRGRKLELEEGERESGKDEDRVVPGSP